MRTHYLFFVLFWFSTTLLAQSSSAMIHKEGKLVRRPNVSCGAVKSAFVLETIEGDIVLDFKGYFGIVDYRTYIDKYVEIDGTWQAEEKECKALKVKYLYLDTDQPDTRKFVKFEEVKGYRLIALDDNPHNDYQVISHEADFQRMFGTFPSGYTGVVTPLNFKDMFYIVVAKNDVKTYLFKNIKMFMRDNALVVDYEVAGVEGVKTSNKTASFMILGLEKRKYDHIVFDENNKTVYRSFVQWKPYDPPKSEEKPWEYKNMVGYRYNASNSGLAERQIAIYQTQKEFSRDFIQKPIRANEKRTEPNFVDELVVVVTKTGKESYNFGLRNVNILKNEIIIRYTAEPSVSKLSQNTNSSYMLILKKGQYNKITFEENAENVGSVTR